MSKIEYQITTCHSENAKRIFQFMLSLLIIAVSLFCSLCIYMYTNCYQTPAEQTRNPKSQIRVKKSMSDSLKREYEVCEEIGRGQFGTVFRCFNLSTNDSFACKSIDKRLLSDSIDRECLEKEPKTMLCLSSHPNIVSLYEAFEDESHLHLIMDLCEPSLDLYQLLSRGPVPEEETAAIAASLVEAMAHCHRRGVCHRDVKPENVLFDSKGRLKLADFGSAEWFGDGRAMSGVVGTPYYVAPEVLMGREYNEKVDVWSTGVILYIMLAGFPPFYGETAQEIFEAVMRGTLRFPFRAFRDVSSGAKDLLRRMICRDVSRRFSAEQVLRHPWILSSGDSSLLSF